MRDGPSWEVQSEFGDAISSFKAAPTSLNILIQGPAGSGKSTLVRNAVRSSNLALFKVSDEILACKSSELVEEGLLSLFCDAVKSAPSVLLLDDIDHWLPTTIANPAQFHLLAHLHQHLSDLQLQGEPVVFVATCRQTHRIHPSALSAFATGRRVIHVHPLSEDDRAAIFRDTFFKDTPSAMAPDADALDSLVACTPGYVAVDMARLLLEAGAIAAGRRNKSLATSDIHSSAPYLMVSDVQSAQSSVRPLLLGAHSKRWSFLPVCDDLPPLFGLEEAQRILKSALTASFSRIPHPALSAMGHIRGIILHGPSGTGKTALLKRSGGYIRPRGSVHILQVDAVDIVSSVVGASERTLGDLFAAARAASPTLILLENLHLLAPRRSELDEERADGSSSAAAFERILATLLTEIDGVRTGDKQVILLASTPNIALVEPAMLRPGRFEMHVELTVPDEEARRKILVHILEMCLPEESAAHIIHDDDLMRKLVRRCNGFSAADIKAVVNESIWKILREDKVKTESKSWIEALNGRRVERELKVFLRE